MTNTKGLERLLQQLEKENTNASEAELRALLVDSVRKDPALVSEAVEWFLDHNHPGAKSTS